MNITEKQIEDFICGHPNYLYLDTVIDRQIVLPHGILDILGVAGYQTFVVELKAVKLKEGDVGQVLRYTYDIEQYLYAAARYYKNDIGGAIMGTNKFTDEEMFRQAMLALRLYEPSASEDPRLVPVLVGKSVDEKVLSAATAANIDVYTWEYYPSNQSFDFRSALIFEDGTSYRPENCDWLSELIVALFRGCRMETNAILTRHCEHLFGIQRLIMPPFGDNHER